MKEIFDSQVIGSMQVPNMFFLSPMCMYSAKDGALQPFHERHYMRYSMSGLGGIIFEATAVSRKGRITVNDLGLYTEEQYQRLGNLVHKIKECCNSKIGIQLSHSGLKGSLQASEDGKQPTKYLSPEEGGWRPIGLSHKKGYVDIINQDMLETISEEFAQAASYAHLAGFDFIEIHMGHGFLLHQFLSPRENQLADSYGGCLENRSKFPLSVFERVRQRFPKDKPVGVRISYDYTNSLDEDIEINTELARKLAQSKCDYVTLSSGGIVDGGDPNSFLLSAQRIMKELNDCKLMVVGGFESTESFEPFVSAGVKLFSIGRPLLRNPNFLYQIAQESGLAYSGPRQYFRAFEGSK